jgi:phosphoribosylanthranilate isomerase
VGVEEAAKIASRLGPFGVIFGVFVDPDPQEVGAALAGIPGLRPQFSGDEPPEFCERLAPGGYLKAFHLGGVRDDTEVIESSAQYPRAFPLFDSWDMSKRGGTGKTFSWERLARNVKPAAFGVCGGLTPENVGRCVRLLRPAAVDVRSGVESGGRKDEEKMRAFVRAVKEADAEA